MQNSALNKYRQRTNLRAAVFNSGRERESIAYFFMVEVYYSNTALAKFFYPDQ